MTKQSVGCGLLQSPNYFQLQLSAAKVQNAIHHWCFNYWCSPVTGPLCTPVIHHKLLPVSSLSPYTCALYKWAPRVPPVYPTNITTLHSGAQVFEQIKLLYMSPAVRSITGTDECRSWFFITVKIKDFTNDKKTPPKKNRVFQLAGPEIAHFDFFFHSDEQIRNLHIYLREIKQAYSHYCHKVKVIKNQIILDWMRPHVSLRLHEANQSLNLL